MRSRLLVSLKSVKLQVQSLTVFILVLSFISCKKESNDAGIAKGPGNGMLILRIQSWLEKQKTDLPETSKARIDSLKGALEYNNLHLEKYRGVEEFIVVPISKSFKSTHNQDKDPVNYLVLVLKNSDSITNGNIIQYVSSNDQAFLPKNTFTKIFTYKNLDCSGQFTVLSVTDHFRYELVFESGRLKSVAEHSKRNAEEGSSGRVNGCIDWYLITTYYFYDGSSSTYETYLGTTCSGDPQCQNTRVVNGRSLRINCGGGSGDGIAYEYFLSRPWKWTVAQTSLYIIKSYETVSGMKVAYEPQGGHFTSIVHVNSYFENAAPDYTWQEDGNTVSMDNSRLVYSSTTGQAIHNPSGHSFDHSGSATRTFAAAFP